MDLMYTSEDFQSQKCSSTQVHPTYTTAVHWCKSTTKQAMSVNGPLLPHSYRTITMQDWKSQYSPLNFYFSPYYIIQGEIKQHSLLQQRARSSTQNITEPPPTPCLPSLSHWRGRPLTQQQEHLVLSAPPWPGPLLTILCYICMQYIDCKSILITHI